MTINRPLVINHGSLETTILTPQENYLFYQQLTSGFYRSLPEPTEGFAGDDEPATKAELLMKFLGYVAAQSTSIDSEKEEAVKLILDEFETRFLRGQDIHTFAADALADDEFPTSLAKVQNNLIRNYYLGKVFLDRSFGLNFKTGPKSALFNAAAAKGSKVSIYAIFGGQGNTEDYFEELREIYQVYHGLISDFLVKVEAKVQTLIANTPDTDKVYTHGFDLINWLEDPSATPSALHLLSIPVSCPLICAIQLCHYIITCKVMGVHPGQLRSILKGTTGHSQGLVTALAIASADSWPSFEKQAMKAIEFLFFLAVRCTQTYPPTSLAPSTVRDSEEHGEGEPGPMLSIRDLSIGQVNKFVAETNRHLPEAKHTSISLVNGARNMVVTGPPESLYGLNLNLRNAKAPAGLNQTRIPFSQRKLKFSSRFLPITSPFHSHLLTPANKKISEDFEQAGLWFPKEDIAIPVFDTYDGSDLRSFKNGSIPLRVVSLITTLPVHWVKATQFKATHIVDFGPGGASGLGVLTHRNKEGTGVRIIVGGALGSSGDDTEYGYKQELFDIHRSSLKFAPNWLENYRPRLVKTKAGKVYVDTKFSRLLGRPPLMVPGMTPTTVSPDFVAATINAGYHIEIAGGGYFAEDIMTDALKQVATEVRPGSGIGINLIYVNPRMLQWGIPMIKKLREQGFPIQSLTIGAGVPSLEVAAEYIETLQLTHLGLKPGSVDAIAQCITIAKAYPNFPIVIQWTGGRGGGHHSFEDFHQPILQMYGKIRRCSNIVLVAGSGFGSAEDTYPYLTGSWSKQFNYPEMPFDGVLFGSRVMIAKEAHTSPAAKEAIAACPGVPDSEWEATYNKPTGGILTVKSEMGEPIHKIATRAVVFWKEMDDTVFSLPKPKMLEALKKKKSYIISKLNAHFQKPWFGKNAAGEVCDLQDMTYEEVAKRSVDLMFVRKSHRWIDPTLRKFTATFLRRVEERFATKPTTSVIQQFAELDTPDKVIDAVFTKYPDARSQLISAEDRDYFINLCLNPIQKPVPFVPVLDANFEFFFKKDSLWQSEDLEAVVDEDVQRTCILQGPVSTQYTTKVDEPIKDILDNIHEGHIERLLKDEYHNDKKSIPVVEYFTREEAVDIESLEGVTIAKNGKDVTYSIGAVVPDAEKWFKLLAGVSYSWRHAFVSSKVFVQGYNHVSNPARKVLSPAKNLVVKISNVDTPESTVITILEPVKGKHREVVKVSISGEKISMQLIESRTAEGNAVALQLFYTYDPSDGFAPIREVTEGRNTRIKEFYWKVWFGSKIPVDLDFSVDATIDGGSTTITSKDIVELTHAVGNSCEYFVPRPDREQLAPMDFAIIIGWKAIMKAIFPKTVDGDILKLVHLSNSYRMLSGASPLKAGDKVSSDANIVSVVNGPTGKTVRVVGHIYREGSEVMQVTSSFFYRGYYTDFENTFEKTVETPMQVTLTTQKDVAVLKSKEWFHCDGNTDLLGKSLTFRLTSVYKFRSADVYSHVLTTGAVCYELSTKEIKKVAEVVYEAGDSFGNPVVDYLSRNGKPIEQPLMFENHIPLARSLSTKSPGSNETYATVSGDYNPIHVSRVFSSYADLPGTITLGMFSSASIRSLVEMYAADGVAPRVRAYTANFVGMVLPNDELSTTLEHVGMINGRKIVKIETKKIETDEVVLTGEAEIDQPITTFVFTGQGSQEQGMGMDLYKSSEVARSVWDLADKHFIDSYGFSILDIVRNNPKELTIHFGGPEGRAVRENYISMMFEFVGPDGHLKSEKIFKDIDYDTTTYTFRSPSGLLSATQFTQPALTLMEKAAFEDMRSKGLVPEKCMFAGHSLGEYSALSSIANVMPIESLVDVVFYRGMTMQVAVPRDELGRSNYGMIAVNPSRVSSTFDDLALRFVIDHIGKQTGWLLEIVNYNVENQQYVAAGDLRGLDTLTNTLNIVKVQKIAIDKLLDTMPVEKVAEHLSVIVDKVSKEAIEKPQPIDLKRGFACIPLKGISVPFHSSYLRSGVKPFERFLVKKIPKSAIKPAELIGRYIPNLTAKPFQITKEYFEYVFELTHSEKIKAILENWESYEKA